MALAEGAKGAHQRTAEAGAGLPAPTARRRYGWLMVVAALAFIPLLIAGFYVFVRYSGHASLRDAMEEADRLDPNWRMVDLEAHRKEVPDSENALVQALAALPLVPSP